VSVNKNNYFDNPKHNDIRTPKWLGDWLYKDIIRTAGLNMDYILDPAIGEGALTNPFKCHPGLCGHNSYIIGIDIDEIGQHHCDEFVHGKFEDIEKWDGYTPDIIVVNPPFNSASGRKLYPEVFLKKIGKLFGVKIPVMMIVPMGFLLNQRIKSSRYRYLRDNWEISSIVALPIDTFLKEDGSPVLFHSEIIFFNFPNLKPYYFLPEGVNNG
jgi:hypothetical protein